MSEIKVNDYIVARYNGESGDVIAGQVVKIRAGKAYMKNLLTGADSERAVEIVNRRNIVAPRKDALAVAEIFHDTDDKQKARKAAVQIANRIKADEEKAAKAEKAKDATTKMNGATTPPPDGRKSVAKAAKTKPAKKTKAPKIVKQKVVKTNGHVDVHVKVSKGNKVLVERVFKVKE